MYSGAGKNFRVSVDVVSDFWVRQLHHCQRNFSSEQLLRKIIFNSLESLFMFEYSDICTHFMALHHSSMLGLFSDKLVIHCS